jgi:hypothetical protein
MSNNHLSDFMVKKSNGFFNGQFTFWVQMWCTLIKTEKLKASLRFFNWHSEWKEKKKDRLMLFSYMSNDGCIKSALAIATLCRCPPLSFMPRSPMTLSYPFGVELTMKSWAPLSFAASMISFKVAYKLMQSIF